MAHNYLPKSSIVIPLKNSIDNTLQNRVQRLCQKSWNLIQQWRSLNSDASKLLEEVANIRIKNISKLEFRFDADMIVHNVENLTEKCLPKFEQICQKFDAVMKMLPVLCQLVFSETASKDTQRRIQRFAEILPQLRLQLEEELTFKRNSLVDFSLCDVKQANSLFSTIFLAWNTEIYIDSNLISNLYSLL